MKSNRHQTVTKTEQLKALLRKSLSYAQLAYAPCRNRTCNLLVIGRIPSTKIRRYALRQRQETVRAASRFLESCKWNRNATVTEVPSIHDQARRFWGDVWSWS
jgi:hypothetical protein